ncbi:hypothetical protein DFH09DRAFT_1400842 [Mycena vulgaris]|nr:hypothetical protein DFH09DRAFT_1400842 [Mycena vulgaris]
MDWTITITLDADNNGHWLKVTVTAPEPSLKSGRDELPAGRNNIPIWNGKEYDPYYRVQGDLSKETLTDLERKLNTMFTTTWPFLFGGNDVFTFSGVVFNNNLDLYYLAEFLNVLLRAWSMGNKYSPSGTPGDFEVEDAEYHHPGKIAKTPDHFASRLNTVSVTGFDGGAIAGPNGRAHVIKHAMPPVILYTTAKARWMCRVGGWRPRIRLAIPTAGRGLRGVDTSDWVKFKEGLDTRGTSIHRVGSRRGWSGPRDFEFGAKWARGGRRCVVAGQLRSRGVQNRIRNVVDVGGQDAECQTHGKSIRRVQGLTAAQRGRRCGVSEACMNVVAPGTATYRHVGGLCRSRDVDTSSRVMWAIRGTSESVVGAFRAIQYSQVCKRQKRKCEYIVCLE